MTTRAPIEVSSTAISYGAESIGLPTVRSVDTLFLAYFELVSRMRSDERTVEVRAIDVNALADATGLETSQVRLRLQSALVSY